MASVDGFGVSKKVPARWSSLLTSRWTYEKSILEMLTDRRNGIWGYIETCSSDSEHVELEITILSRFQLCFTHAHHDNLSWFLLVTSVVDAALSTSNRSRYPIFPWGRPPGGSTVGWKRQRTDALVGQIPRSTHINSLPTVTAYVLFSVPTCSFVFFPYGLLTCITYSSLATSFTLGCSSD